MDELDKLRARAKAVTASSGLSESERKRLRRLNREFDNKDKLRQAKKAGAPSESVATNEERVALHKQQIRLLDEALKDTQNSYARAVMKNDLEGHRSALRLLLGVPKKRDLWANTGRIEKSVIR